LYHRAAAQENIEFTPIKSIEKIKCDSSGAHITTDIANFSADLLIACDGTTSSCRDLLGISSQEKNHGDIARIYQLQLAEDHDFTAYERFTKHGALAMLPLFDKKRAQLVWTKAKGSASASDRATCTERSTEETLNLFNNIFEGKFSTLSVEKISEFPLKTIIAEKQITQSAVLLGNAAHTIYPLAAQGFNLGLHDVAALSETLIDAHKNHQKIGDLSVLKKYEARVKDHQQAIFCLTNQLTSIFELPLIGGLRGLGLLATDIITPIKNKLAKRTMGLAGKMPKLLRGFSRE
jgi:2-octaprenyl-6-methoxyphenol hydroxylase